MAKIFGIAIILCMASPSLAEGAKTKYLFEIPIYPGLIEVGDHPDFSILSSPFVTVEEIYRTKNRNPLDPKTVIAFYRENFYKKGWKTSANNGTSENSLRLNVVVYETFPDGTYIHVAGDFYLITAPKDGILLIYLRQWRISHASQATLNQVSAILAQLDSLVQKINYSKDKVEAGGPWKKRYENEYLTSWVMFGLFDNSVKTSDVLPEGHIAIELMTYRDPGAAKNAELAIEESSAYRETVRIGNIVILIENDARDRTEIAGKLAAALRN